jgi:hypothetical protein
MKTFVIIFLSILLITGTDVRPVFVHMFRALSYAAESTVSGISGAPVQRQPVSIPEEPAPTPIKLPFLESPTASTTEDLTLEEALEEAEQIRIGRESKNK